MIDFQKLKLVLFDFDDTLCIHTYHEHTPQSSLEYHINILQNSKDTWRNSQSNTHIYQFIKKCEKNNIKMGLISVTLSYQHAQAKQIWISNNYDINMENYCVASAADKVKMMTLLAAAYKMSHDEILIVDDLYETLISAANAGFQACTPMEVVNFITNSNAANNI